MIKTMNRRRNFADTLAHRQPENIIIDLGGCPLSGMSKGSLMALMKYLDLPMLEDYSEHKLPENLLEALDIDTRSVGWIFTPKRSQYHKISDTEYIDEWGIRRIFTGLYFDIIENPLKDATLEDLEAYDWPDPMSVSMEEIEAEAERAKFLYENTDYVICASHPTYGIFELGCWMCGFEDFLMKTALEPEFVHRFFEIILDYQKKVSQMYYGALGKHIHYTSSGDDFATQSNLFLSKQNFQQLIAPYFKERIAFTKNLTNAAFLHHSCGSVYKIIDDLIDCGVDILNPIQPLARDMAPENIKNAFGDKIVFHGGLDTQEVLPYGDQQLVESTVKHTIQTLNQNGGYIFAAAHNLQDDAPPQSIVTMLKAARQYGKRD